MRAVCKAYASALPTPTVVVACVGPAGDPRHPLPFSALDTLDVLEINVGRECYRDAIVHMLRAVFPPLPTSSFCRRNRKTATLSITVIDDDDDDLIVEESEIASAVMKTADSPFYFYRIELTAKRVALNGALSGRLTDAAIVCNVVPSKSRYRSVERMEISASLVEAFNAWGGDVVSMFPSMTHLVVEFAASSWERVGELLPSPSAVTNVRKLCIYVRGARLYEGDDDDADDRKKESAVEWLGEWLCGRYGDEVADCCISVPCVRPGLFRKWRRGCAWFTCEDAHRANTDRRVYRRVINASRAWPFPAASRT